MLPAESFYNILLVITSIIAVESIFIIGGLVISSYFHVTELFLISLFVGMMLALKIVIHLLRKEIQLCSDWLTRKFKV